MQQSPVSLRRAWKRRALSLVMSLVLTLGLVPGVPGLESDASAHWADTYLSQLVEWGFIRADQAGYPDRALTRADFMAITNRAYGYHEPGETPFEDVAENDWFYDDVGIAYTAKYIKGTSPTTASPNSPLTRETAATILGRNMMLQESAGELLDFTDARQISNWARGTVKSSLEHYLVSGYSDGTFRPQRNVSWGEMAAMVTNLIGTPLQEPGDYSLGGTFGNVTITSPGVTLRDTVVSGDLYISGGVGLGDVVLENVTVLGRIIASGTGSSEGGEDSILLRNVTADELLVDNLQGNNVSVRADGVTEIGRTTVRTNAYIEDNTPEGMGLKYISVEGETYPEGEEPDDWEPIQVALAGRIEEVVNRTPQSTIHVGRGTVAKLTVDEAATESFVIIDRGAVVNELNLDTTTEVTGEGDIGKLVVNAPGCVVEMLPDQIEIRPGLTAEIAGEEMDTVAAEESSEEPRILAGYPQARDIIPNGLDAVFMTNKSGTIYWAVSALTDGSIGEEDLIKPPSYGSKAVRTGSLAVAKGNEETTAKITGLTPGGSYYLSAVLVDARDKRSTVKVISFTTPDNTVPAFNNGYPKMSKVSRTDSVVVVMPNKDCKLYYALLPEGATAPTENELKTNSVAGALGYGVRDVKKNVEDAFRVNDVILDETTNYVLYLWLVDADGVNKGKIFPLKFTTDDETPPEFISGPTQVKTQATSVGLEYQLSENGTVYWVAVPAGTVYPKPEPGTSYERAPLDSDYAILQVVSGMNVGADGKYGRVTAKQGVNGTINISGLKPESVYDLYYVAKDNAGPDRNYSVSVLHMTINTEDNKPPVFTQTFSSTSDGTSPRADTSIFLDVTEDLLYLGQNGGKSLLELYQETQTGTEASRAEARDRLAANLRSSIVLHKYDVQTKREENIYLKHQTSDTRTDWTVDYTLAKVEARREGGIRITFPSESLQLENGGQYCFIINDLADTSNARNPIEPDTGVDFWNYPTESARAGHDVKPFVVDLPTVNLDVPVVGDEGPLFRDTTGTSPVITNDPVRMDMSFYMEPVSTKSMGESISYDVLLWSRTTMRYDLYYRVVDSTGTSLTPIHEETSPGVYAYPATAPSGDTDYLLRTGAAVKGDNTPDKNGWIYLGNSGLTNPPENGWSGRSVSSFFNGCDSSNFGKLNKLSENLQYQFVISLTFFDGKEDTDRTGYRSWNDTARLDVNVAAGQAQNLDHLAGSLTHDEWESYLSLGIIRGAQSVGRWRNDQNQVSDTQQLSRKFSVLTLPNFINNAPEFSFNANGDVSISLNLEAAGTVHYAISEVDPRTGRPLVTTIREVMEDTSDYTDDTNTTYADGVEVISNGATPPQMYVSTFSPRPPQKGGTSTVYPMLDWMKGGDGATDDPEGKNKIVDPSNLLVVSKNWRDQVVDSGAFTPQEGVNDTMTSDKVKPNTTYFAYFVITSVDNYDNMSHVYIYQFTTPEAMKPSVLLDASDGTGNVTMSIDVATKGAYRVISKSDAQDPERVSVLNQPFGKYTGHTGNVNADGTLNSAAGNFTDGTPENFLVNADGTPFTVLDALLTPYSYTTASPSPDRGGDLTKDPSYPKFYYPDRGGDAFAYAEGYTVFDMYASDSGRDQLYNFILNGTRLPPEIVNIDNWGPTGRTDTKAPGRDETRAETLLEIGEDLRDSQYLFLTYAINPKMVQADSNPNSSQNTSLIASFSGVMFQKGKMLPPEVDGASGSITKDSAGETYSGRVRIHFDNDTYLRGPSKAVTMTRDNLLTGDGVELFRNGSVSVYGTPSQSAFTLVFNSVHIGDSLVFPDRYFANLNNEEAKKELEISVTKENETVYLVVTWPGAKDSPWKIPLSEAGGDHTLRLTDTTKLLQGPQSALTLELTAVAGGTPGSDAVKAEMDPNDLSNPLFTWVVPTGSSELTTAVSGTGSEDCTITAAKPGKTTVTVNGIGTDNAGTMQSASNMITVTVLGAVTDLTITPEGNASATGNSLTMPIGGTQNPSATVTAAVTGGTLSGTASLACEVTGTARQYVNCDVNGLRITVSPTRNAPTSGTAEVTVKLTASDGTELTPNAADKKTFTVTFSDGKSTTPTPAPPRQTPAARPTLSLDPIVATIAVGRSTTATATVTPAGTAVKWSSSNEKVATVVNGKITGVGIGTTTISGTVTSGNYTVSRNVTVRVTGSVTGLTESSSNNAAWKASSKTLTLTKAPNVSPSAVFAVKTSGAMTATAAVRCSVVDSSGKDASKYVSCTVGTNGAVTIRPGSAAQKNSTFTVTVDLVTREDGVSLTSKGGAYTFTVQIKGSDSGLNVASRKTS